MKVKYWFNLKEEFREIVCKNYRALYDLKQAYEKAGWEGWMNLFDCNKGEWMLTVKRGG